MFRNTKRSKVFKAIATTIVVLFLLLLTTHCAKSAFDNGNPEQPEDQGKPEENEEPGGSLNYKVIDTGQESCYNNRGNTIAPPQDGDRYYGQDAQYQGLQMSYKDNGDGTISDLNTGLMWQKTPDFENLRTPEEAGTYAGNLVLAGHSDWRLPTIKELYSIAAFYGSMQDGIPYIDTDYFDFQYPDPATGLRDMDAQYISATYYVGTCMYGSRAVFGFNFADGRIKGYGFEGGGPGGGFARYVRCVRGSSDYGVNEFVDNGDGTITDKATGLMWQKSDSGQTMNWEDALEYGENLVQAGYEDWRLPNTKELQSIVDYTRAPDASDPNYRSAAIDPIFDITEEESWFWTSTSHGDNLAFGIYICFGRGLSAWQWQGEAMNAHGAGAQRSDPKSGDPDDMGGGHGPQGDEIRIYNYVRCVRTADSE